MFGLRLGQNPQVVITTTPRPTKIVKELIADPDCITVRGSTYENKANLAPSFFTSIIRKYEGTRLGRQELNAEVLDDNPGALWQREIIERTRVSQVPPLSRIVVGVDPEASSEEESAETGIIVAGLGLNGHGYVLDDRTLRGTPAEWGRQAVAAYHRWTGDRVVAEVNNGGEMVLYVLSTIDHTVAAKAVHASRAKQARAEPVSSLWEQGRCHMVGAFAELEDQMCLSGDTLVATATGPVRIDRVLAGDWVWTRAGLRRVVWAGRTGTAPAVVDLTTSDGRNLLATGGHLIFEKDTGFVPASDLAAGDRLEIGPWRNTGPAYGGTVTGGPSTTGAITETSGPEDSCIASYGSANTAPSRPGLSFIIGTGTAGTTTSRTSSPSLRASTSGFIQPGSGRGTSDSIAITFGGHGRTVSPAPSPVAGAGPSSSPSVCGPRIARGPVAAGTITGARNRLWNRPVYNLQVDGPPEFFANGILVHNCEWVPAQGLPSPDRLDALVWAITDLMLDVEYEAVVYEEPPEPISKW